jgi:hypothetical protein
MTGRILDPAECPSVPDVFPALSHSLNCSISFSLTEMILGRSEIKNENSLIAFENLG